MTTQTNPVQHLVLRTHTASYEYDPEKALRLYHLLVPEIPDGPYAHYRDAGWRNDEDRIVSLFEILDGSLFQDAIFGSLADDDVGHELKTRGWDE